MHVDLQGVSYLRDTTTGERYELSEDEMELNSPIPEEPRMQYEIGHLSGSLHMLRDEVSNRMDALSESAVGASHKLESALENNLRILRATGATDVRDVRLAELAASIRSSARQPPTDMEEQQPSIDRALPPQCITANHGTEGANKNYLFWTVFEFDDQFPHIALSFAQVILTSS
ncbi:hypothetical protein K438DRAFT_2061433 [Mycena galopus ATCC 62051]|nr:hypothetical protein K438DRAFT_2061433 [Mycena galopus ATCC 62051]